MRVQDKSIIVTGAGGGIGEGIARRLAGEGSGAPQRGAGPWLDENCSLFVTARQTWRRADQRSAPTVRTHHSHPR